jgi:hypothetical protein
MEHPSNSAVSAADTIVPATTGGNKVRRGELAGPPLHGVNDELGTPQRFLGGEIHNVIHAAIWLLLVAALQKGCGSGIQNAEYRIQKREPGLRCERRASGRRCTLVGQAAGVFCHSAAKSSPRMRRRVHA